MKYVLSILALLMATDASAAEENQVTGVLCKKKEDLTGALQAGNLGTFLPDALATRPGCQIILTHPVPVRNAKFLGWVPAGIVKVPVYSGYTDDSVTNDEGQIIPNSTGEWFFTPSEKSGIVPPKKVYPIVPV